MEHSTPDVEPLISTPTDAAVSHPDGLERTPAGERLSELAERAAAILERWTVAGDRHERAVNQLETQLTEFEAANARLQRDTSQKMQDLERAVHSEWTALREIHDEPIRQLREQANSLTEVCIATAHSAQRGFDQAEARLAALERELQQRLSELRGEVQAVAGELRGAPALARLGANPPAWPLDGVTRLHQQLRDGVETAADAPDQDLPTLQSLLGPVTDPSIIDTTASAQPASSAPPASPASTATVSTTTTAPTGNPELADRVRGLERALDEREAETREVAERARRSTSMTRNALIALAAVIVIGGAFAWWLQGQMRTRVEDAQRRAQEATDATAQQTAAVREQASKDIAAARTLAQQAQIVSAALAAPDLVRFVLAATGEDAAGGAQALWSRTRGFVLSGSRLAPVPEGTVYQIWLITRGEVVSAGTLTPDATGSATLVVPPPTTLPVIGVVATQEPVGGSPRPVGRPLLVRYRAQP